MKARRWILAAALAGAVLTVQTPALGRMTPEERRIEMQVRRAAAERQKLGPDQQAMLRDILSHMEKQVQRLRDKDRLFPGQLYGALAGQLTRQITYLKSCEFKYFPEAPDDKMAFVVIPGTKTVHLCPSFFKQHSGERITEEAILSHEKKFGEKSTWRREAELARELRLGTQASTLIHEMVHSGRQTVYDKLDLWGGRGEGQSYTAQYKWLKVLNEDVHREYKTLTGKDLNSFELQNVLSWLKKLGLIETNTDEAALEKFGGSLQIPYDVEGKVPFDVPEGPKVDGKDLSDARRGELLNEINAWEKSTLALLREGREVDPQRLANKQAFLGTLEKFTGRDRELTCVSCAFGGTHWWFTDRWSCPRCEHCLLPSEVLRNGGSNKTFRQFAIERMRIYDQKILDVQRQAAALRQALGY